MATGNNVSEKLTNIQNQKVKIRDWLSGIGKAETASKLEDCATAIAAIPVYLNAEDFNIAEGTSYTIPEGYHDGTQTITNVSEEESGAYQLYSYPPITPTKMQQSFPIPTDKGYYGLSAFSVEPIPEAYQDVTSVTATAETVLTGKVFVTKSGGVVAGTMSNNGGVVANFTGLTPATSTYTIPKGYHDGTGKVSLTDDIERLLAEI